MPHILILRRKLLPHHLLVEHGLLVLLLSCVYYLLPIALQVWLSLLKWEASEFHFELLLLLLVVKNRLAVPCGHLRLLRVHLHGARIPHGALSIRPVALALYQQLALTNELQFLVHDLLVGLHVRGPLRPLCVHLLRRLVQWWGNLLRTKGSAGLRWGGHFGQRAASGGAS